MMQIKEPLLLIRKSIPCGGSEFPFSLSKWSFTICVTPSNRKYNVLSASVNKKMPFLPLLNLCMLTNKTKTNLLKCYKVTDGMR